MHEKDRAKIMAAGFELYRCSETELVVKKRTAAWPNWRLVSRYKTKKDVKIVHSALLDNPNIIQD